MESFNSKKPMIYKKINNIDKNKGTNSQYIYSKPNKNLLSKERQNSNYYIFPEFNYHYGYKSKQNYNNINPPHFSIYSDSPLILNKDSRNDLLNESIRLKKEKNKLKNELNREKALKDVGSQYLKLLKNKYLKNNFNSYKKEEENKIKYDEQNIPIWNHSPETNFNYMNCDNNNRLEQKEINNNNNNSIKSFPSETSKLIHLVDKVLENYKNNKKNKDKTNNNKFFNYQEYKKALKENITNINDKENDNLNNSLKLNEIIKKYRTMEHNFDTNTNIIKDQKEDINYHKVNSYYKNNNNENKNKTTINNDLNSINSTKESFNKSSDNIIKNNTFNDSSKDNIKSIEYEKNSVNQRYIIVDENGNQVIINGKKLLGMDLITLGEEENRDIILMGPDGEPKTSNELELILLDDNRPLVNEQNRPFLGLCGVALINREGYPVVGPGELYDKNEEKVIGSLGCLAKDNNGNPIIYLKKDDNYLDKNEEENLNDDKYIFNGKYISIIEHNINKSNKKISQNRDFINNYASLNKNREHNFTKRHNKKNNIVKKFNINRQNRRIKNKYLIKRSDKMEKGNLTFSQCDINTVKKIKYYKENNYKVTCFACDVGCSVSKTGYSKMNYSPYNNLIRRREETPTK